MLLSIVSESASYASNRQVLLIDHLATGWQSIQKHVMAIISKIDQRVWKVKNGCKASSHESDRIKRQAIQGKPKSGMYQRGSSPPIQKIHVIPQVTG